MMRHSHQLRDIIPSEYYGYCSRDGLEDPSDGCEDNISEWLHRG
jgi:hypothetical protein